MNAFEQALAELVGKRREGWEQRFLPYTDQLLERIELARLAGRRRLDDDLWDRLAECADAVGQEADPPDGFADAHGYLLDLQGDFLAERQGAKYRQELKAEREGYERQVRHGQAVAHGRRLAARGRTA